MPLQLLVVTPVLQVIVVPETRGDSVPDVVSGVPVAVTVPEAVVVTVEATESQILMGLTQKVTYFVVWVKPDSMGLGPLHRDACRDFRTTP